MKSFFSVVLLAASVTLVAPATAVAATDQFADACMSRGNSARTCACQAKIARTSFNPMERRAALGALTGGADSLRASLAQMGEAKGKAFLGKMRTLGQRTERECR